MPRATPDYTTPELREVCFVRAAVAIPIILHQPISRKRSRTITGHLLGETRFDGKLHHYRIAVGDGVIYLAPREWLSPESVAAIDAANMNHSAVQAANRLAVLENLARQLYALSEPEGLA